MNAKKRAVELTRRLGAPCEQVTEQLLDNCYEFEPADLGHLRPSATLDENCAALIPLWTDLRYGHTQPDLLVGCAIAKTATVLANFSVLGDSLLQDLLARVFDALVAQPSHIDVSAPPFGDFARVITSVCIEHQNDWSLDWLPLANSCVSIWPGTFDAVFQCFSSQSYAIIPFIAYVTALAYQTRDHPWSKQLIPLWRRFGEIEMPAWNERSTARLLEVLDVDLIRARLVALPRSFPLPSGDHSSAGSLIDELLSLQLETDYARRCAILVRNLRSRERQLVWDDEWGMTVR